MRIIVSDSSCLIDLRKVGLVEAFLKLPYEFLIPNTLFDVNGGRFPHKSGVHRRHGTA